ncbi:peptidase M10A and M12B matrixin and adamalysin [Pseudarthrobacter phenanthrenivorans]|uniref:Peptidase M10A and M12B matrixin and adamalysin n=1 Tax=Pseudarthrobacter phenanthrenivorans TaxID=361575 RepID=A0A3B0G212_PSEPS|nr:matrixin family metalloprotease [Pseudarthrobacter phenanthrenivorans]RKO26008.1 peptidase M10A and M12B matrixin and adamalysin [Pseudarthrobacter phenanthrenivorans]
MEPLPPGEQRQEEQRQGGSRHAAARVRRGAREVSRLFLIAALTTVGVVGAAVVLDGPRFKELLEVRIGPGKLPPGAQNGSQADQPAGQAGQTPQSETRMEAPPPGFEESKVPLAAASPPAVGSDAYQFLAVNGDGTPVGYSPCRPLHYVVNDGLAPAGSQHLVTEAITSISAATGIQFVYDGTTLEQPSPQRPPYQPDAYGERWAPLLIAWTTPETAPQLKGKVIGTGGSTHFSYDSGPKTFVTGGLDLDAPQIADELLNPDGHLYASAVILHELSHVMGLDHVEDPTQLMYPEIGTPAGLSAGDLNGLFELGQAQCRKDL